MNSLLSRCGGLLLLALMMTNASRGADVIQNTTYTSAMGPVREQRWPAVEVGPAVTVQAGADVAIRSPESVTLKPGFTVAPGGLFAAKTTSLRLTASRATLAPGETVVLTASASGLGTVQYLDIQQNSPHAGHYGVGDSGGEVPPGGASYPVLDGHAPFRQLTLTLTTPGIYEFQARAQDAFWHYGWEKVRVTVTATGAGPAIVGQPDSRAVVAGSTVSFTVLATGAPAPTYQWRKNGVNISGATAATLTLANVTGTHAGIYTVVVANSAGSVTSNQATLSLSGATHDSANDNKLNIHLPTP